MSGIERKTTKETRLTQDIELRGVKPSNVAPTAQLVFYGDLPLEVGLVFNPETADEGSWVLDRAMVDRARKLPHMSSEQIGDGDVKFSNELQDPHVVNLSLKPPGAEEFVVQLPKLKLNRFLKETEAVVEIGAEEPIVMAAIVEEVELGILRKESE